MKSPKNSVIRADLVSARDWVRVRRLKARLLLIALWGQERMLYVGFAETDWTAKSSSFIYHMEALACARAVTRFHAPTQ